MAGGESGGDAPLVLLANLGTPTEPTPEAVATFLREFLSDPWVVDWPRWLWKPVLEGLVLRRRPPRVAALYRELWTDEGSPLLAGTQRLARALERRLERRATVRAVLRYGPENIEQQVRRHMAESSSPCVVLPLFAQRTGSTTGTIAGAAEAGASAAPGRLCLARLAADDPDYVAALAATFEQAVAEKVAPPRHLLVSFHGVPVSHERRDGGIYARECRATFQALLERLAWPAERATLCFQSRFGPGKWLTPATEPQLVDLARRGVTRVALIAPGFLTEGLETLEELDLRAATAFRRAGGEDFLRVPALEDHPRLVAGLETAVCRTLERAPSPAEGRHG
ncbi:MAG: ferrochelatase [Acidobacteriota bacterium]|nr:ferrochelatase [Acidobacteriota bacterium]MDQ7086432.1 ferrochelatase [Acidobacteriota bacterium]